MKYRRRIYYSATQRAEIWDRWQRGESMSSIGRVFDRQSSSVFSVISPTGGIRPPGRRRGSRALSLSEREEISRGLSIKRSLRVIAHQLGRAPSTISREVRRNGGSANYRATTSDQAAWDRALRPKTCKLACHPALITRQVLDRVLTLSIHCELIPNAGRCPSSTAGQIVCLCACGARAGPWPFVSDIGPDAGCPGLFVSWG